MIDSIKSGNKLDKSDYEKLNKEVNKGKEIKNNGLLTKNERKDMVSENPIQDSEQPKINEGKSDNEIEYIINKDSKVLEKSIPYNKDTEKFKKQRASLTDLRKQMGLVKGEQTKKILDSRKEKDNNKNAEGFSKS